MTWSICNGCVDAFTTWLATGVRGKKCDACHQSLYKLADRFRSGRNTRDRDEDDSSWSENCRIEASIEHGQKNVPASGQYDLQIHVADDGTTNTSTCSACEGYIDYDTLFCHLKEQASRKTKFKALHLVCLQDTHRKYLASRPERLSEAHWLAAGFAKKHVQAIINFLAPVNKAQSDESRKLAEESVVSSSKTQVSSSDADIENSPEMDRYSLPSPAASCENILSSSGQLPPSQSFSFGKPSQSFSFSKPSQIFSSSKSLAKFTPSERILGSSLSEISPRSSWSKHESCSRTLVFKGSRKQSTDTNGGSQREQSVNDGSSDAPKIHNMAIPAANRERATGENSVNPNTTPRTADGRCTIPFMRVMVSHRPDWVASDHAEKPILAHHKQNEKGSGAVSSADGPESIMTSSEPLIKRRKIRIPEDEDEDEDNEMRISQEAKV